MEIASLTCCFSSSTFIFEYARIASPFICDCFCDFLGTDYGTRGWHFGAPKHSPTRSIHSMGQLCRQQEMGKS